MMDSDKNHRGARHTGKRIFRKIPVLLSIGVMLFPLSAFASSAATAPYETTVLYGVNYRSGPSMNDQVYRMLRKGEMIHVIDEEGSWLHIATQDNTTGYISASSKFTNFQAPSATEDPIAAQPPAPTPASAPAQTSYETTVLNGVNFRRGPSLSSTVIRLLRKGEPIHVISGTKYWLNVEDQSGQTGYISASSRYTDYQAPDNSAPVTQPAPAPQPVTQPAPTDPQPAPQPVTQPAPTDPQPAPAPVSFGQTIVNTAESFEGKVTYKLGVRNISTLTFDCSSFTQYVFKLNGVSIPWGATSQSKLGQAVDKTNLEPGDLVFFSVATPGKIGHVGIYVGNGQFINNLPKRGVVLSNVNSAYWTNHYITATRISG